MDETNTSSPATALVRRSPYEQVTELVAQIEGIKTLADFLCKSTLLPASMQTPANLQLVLMQGLEMGFSVVQAIRASFVITSKKGPAKIGYYVEALVALVRRSSVCRFFRVDVATSDRCSVTCARTDEAEDVTHSFDLTMAEAQRSNLDKEWERDEGTGKFVAKQKYTWFTAPSDMLRNRCCGRAVKTVFQDVVFGMATPDELDDLDSAEQLGRGGGFAPAPVHYASAAAMPSEPRVVRDADIVDAEIVEDTRRAPAPESTGDAAWDEFLIEIGKLAAANTAGWLPPDVDEAFVMALARCTDRVQVNQLGPWITAAGTRASRSKTVGAAAAHMRDLFNQRNAELRKREAAGPERANGGAR